MTTPWILTDDDCCQYRRQISGSINDSDDEPVFELYQILKLSNGRYSIIHDYVRLSDYDLSEFICPMYGYSSLEGVKRTYGDDWMGVMAECIFEAVTQYQNGMIFKTWREAKEMIERSIGKENK